MLSACGGATGQLGSQPEGTAPLGSGTAAVLDGFIAAKQRLDPARSSPAAGPATEIAAPSGSSLPSVASLSRSASLAPDIALAAGKDYDISLPSRSVSVADPKLTLSPGGGQFSDLAFAIYRFNLPNFAGTPQVETFWTTPPAAGDLYYAVAEFGKQRWVWLDGGSGAAAVLPAGDYSNQDDEVFVAVFVKGQTDCLLDYVRYGGNVAPVPVATAEPVFGLGAFVTTLSGVLSSDVDGFIANWEWDLDNDGTFEVDTDSVPYWIYELPSATDTVIGMRVTDDEGLTSSTTFTLLNNAPGYDEVEPNDSGITPANMLPPGSFIGWEGNIGEGGYDGSTTDIYGLTALTTQLVHLRLSTLNGMGLPVRMTLLAPDGTTVLLAGNEQPDKCRLDALLPGPGTYGLKVECPPGAGNVDYLLDCNNNYFPAYSEVENNDSTAEAQSLGFDPVTDFRASLGSGGFDGDGEDFYRVQGYSGQGCMITANFPTSAADIDMELLAPDGQTIVASSSSGQLAPEQIYIVFPDDQEYFLRCFMNPGAPPEAVADYYLDTNYLGEAPIAALSITPDNGAAPLTVTVDTSASSAAFDDYIAAVYFDWNSDGVYDYNVNSAGTFQVVLYEPRTYNITAKVVQGDGQSATASDTVDVSGTVDEIEPNDSFATAEVLPSDNFSNFVGVSGPGADAEGVVDYYKVTASSNGTLTFDLDHENAFATINIEVYSSDTLVASDYGLGDHLQVSTPVTNGQELYLIVSGLDFTELTHGYNLDCSVN